MRRIGPLLVISLVAVVVASASAQDAVVQAVRAQGITVDTRQIPDLQPGAKLGFIRNDGSRTEVGQGWVLSAGPGTATVGVGPGASVRPGDLAIRCGLPGQLDSVRAALAQLRDQAVQTGQMTPQFQAKLDHAQGVLAARDGAIQQGACDTSAYDQQLPAIATELQTLASRPVQPPSYPSVPGAAGAASSSVPPTPAGFQPPVPAPAQGATTPGQSPPQGPADSAIDSISKLGDAVQSLMSKFGNRGDTPQQGVTGSDESGSSSPQLSGSPPTTGSGSTSSVPDSLSAQPTGNPSGGQAPSGGSQPTQPQNRPPYHRVLLAPQTAPVPQPPPAPPLPIHVVPHRRIHQAP